MLEKLDLFPTVALKVSCSNWDVKKNKILSLIDWDNPDYLNDQQISDYYNNINNGCAYIKDFCEILKEEIEEILEFSGASDIAFKNLWGQRYKTSQYMEAHNHGALDYSSVLYAEFDPEEHRPTRFISPVQGSDGNCALFEPYIKEGDIFIFPSFLLHDSRPNKSEKNRTIFSFNFRLV